MLLKKRGLIIIIIIGLIAAATVFLLGRFLDKKPIVNIDKPQLEKNKFEYFIDFEDNRYISNANRVSGKKYLSEKNSGNVSGYKSYSPSILIPVPTNDSTLIDDLKVKFWLNPDSQTINASLVFSILDQNMNQIHWDSYPIKITNAIAGNWQVFQHSFDFPTDLVKNTNTIKLYLWNFDDSENFVYIDDMHISLNENFVPESPRSKFFDFEKTNDKKISSKYSLSGFYSTFAQGKDAFSSSVKIPIKEIKYENLYSIAYSFHYLSEKPVIDAAFVISICDSLGNDVYWNSTHLSFTNHQTEVWDIGNGNAIIPADAIDPANTIKIYLWNRNDNTIYLDDIYIVIKESNSNDDKPVAHNFLTNKTFEKKSNNPPYEYKYASLYKLPNQNLSELNKIFTSSKKYLVGKFDEQSRYDQILALYQSDASLLGFEPDNIKSRQVSFNPELPKRFNAFTDHDILLITDLDSKNANIYKYNVNKQVFEVIANLKISDPMTVAGISKNIDSSLSLFLNNGVVSTYLKQNDEFIEITKNKLVYPEFGNLKFYKANFIDGQEHVLLLFLQNKQDRYHLYQYHTETNSWLLSNLHSNKSSQSFDKLDFLNDYFPFVYNDESQIGLLKFDKTERFILQYLNFNKMSYEILFDIDFKDYPKKQNPKYYEICKIITGNFIGGNESEILIFQDNYQKVDWLTQKVEIYRFD